MELQCELYEAQTACGRYFVHEREVGNCASRQSTSCVSIWDHGHGIGMRTKAGGLTWSMCGLAKYVRRCSTRVLSPQEYTPVMSNARRVGVL